MEDGKKITKKKSSGKEIGLLHHIDFAIKRLMFKFFVVCVWLCRVRNIRQNVNFNDIDYTIKFWTEMK